VIDGNISPVTIDVKCLLTSCWC